MTNSPGLQPLAVKPSTVTLMGKFIVRWSLAETCLLMPLSVAKNLRNQDQLHALIAHKPAGTKIEIVRKEVESSNKVRPSGRNVLILSALDEMQQLSTERNRILHDLWVIDFDRGLSGTVDYRLQQNNSGRIVYRYDEDLRILCNRTLAAAVSLCKASKSPWLTEENTRHFFIHPRKSLLTTLQAFLRRR